MEKKKDSDSRAEEVLIRAMEELASDNSKVDSGRREKLVPSRILLSESVDRAVDQALKKVNADFTAGKVGRTQLVNWSLELFFNRMTNEEIQEVRLAHFDEIAYLENLLKMAKATGSLPKELEALVPPSAKAAKPTPPTSRHT